MLETQRAAWARGEWKLVEASLAERRVNQPIESFDKDILLSLICSEDAIRRKGKASYTTTSTLSDAS